MLASELVRRQAAELAVDNEENLFIFSHEMVSELQLIRFAHHGRRVDRQRTAQPVFPTGPPQTGLEGLPSSGFPPQRSRACADLKLRTL